MEKGIKELLVDELHDILSAEEQIIKALPEMAKAAESKDLKEAFESHLKETRGQIVRLGKIFKILKMAKRPKFCHGMEGLIKEGKEVLKDFTKKSSVRDAALISKAQRIEHYEIAAYGTARNFAKELGHRDISALLQETLNEEGAADKKLTKLAAGGFLTSGINHKANLPEVETKSRTTPKHKTEEKSKSSSKIRSTKPKGILGTAKAKVAAIPRKIKAVANKGAKLVKRKAPPKAKTKSRVAVSKR